jgi:hypothetical protein
MVRTVSMGMWTTGSIRTTATMARCQGMERSRSTTSMATRPAMDVGMWAQRIIVHPENTPFRASTVAAVVAMPAADVPGSR